MNSQSFLSNTQVLIVAMTLMIITSISLIFYYLRPDPQPDISHLLTSHRGRHAAQEDSLILLASVEWHRPNPSSPRSSSENLLVDFVFVFSRTHCGNCVQDEVSRLNQIYAKSPVRVQSVLGYSLDEPSDSLAVEFNSSYAAIAFPILYEATVRNYFGTSLGQIPVLFIINSYTNEIIDVHRPIPTDNQNLNAFFTRWHRILDIQ